MQEKHPSHLQRPPRWPCPFVECKCHKPGFRYKVHFLDHLAQCHRKWYQRAKVHPQMLRELHNPRQIRDRRGESIPWITALDFRLRFLERKAQRIALARGRGGGGEGGGIEVGSSRRITISQRYLRNNTVPESSSSIPTYQPYYPHGQPGNNTAPEGIFSTPTYQSYYAPGQPGNSTISEGNFSIPTYQPYYPQNAVYGGVPSFGADPSDYAPNVQHNLAYGSPTTFGPYPNFYNSALARTGMAPRIRPPTFPSRAMAVRGPNVSPSGSGSVNGDEGTPGRQQQS